MHKERHGTLANQRQLAKPTRRGAAVLSPEVDPLVLQRAVANPASALPADIQALQRAYGNQAVTGLIQAEPKVGPVGDRYQQEASRVVEQVMGMPTPVAAGQSGKGSQQPRPAIQRKVTFKPDDDPAGPDVTIADYTPTGQEKIAVDEAVGYIDAGTKVEDQAWAKARTEANDGKVPNAVKKFRWEYPHRNKDGDLPGKKNAGGYLEYYVRWGDNTNSGEHPTRRIVIRESDGNKFYTNTHYGDQGAPPFYDLK